MHVAAVQYDADWEDRSANRRQIADLLNNARLEAGTFVVLPEMADTGFNVDLDHLTDDESLDWAVDLARQLDIWLQVGHVRRGPDGRGQNCASILTPQGDTVGTYVKVHLFTIGHENDNYTSGEHLLVTRCDKLTTCPLTCYDLRFPELWRLGAVAGAELFTIGACWPSVRQVHFRTLLIARAIECQAFVIGANRTGSDPGIPYAGGSMIISPRGQVLAEAGDEPTVLKALLDPPECRAWRKQFPALNDLRRPLLGSIQLHAPNSPDRQ
jgi:predicted amidohydrolase